MLLGIGKHSARARVAADSAAAQLGPSQYESVPSSTITLDEPGIYHAAHEAANVGTYSERIMLGEAPAAAWELPGLSPDPQTVLAPAVGSENLTAPRDAGGRPGTQRLNRPIGPVQGPSSVWSGNQTAIGSDPIGASGPVGVSDYSSQLGAAYAAANRAVLNQATAEAALVAAL